MEGILFLLFGISFKELLLSQTWRKRFSKKNEAKKKKKKK